MQNNEAYFNTTEEFGSIDTNECQENTKSTDINASTIIPSQEFEITTNFSNEKCRKESKPAMLAGRSIIAESITPILTEERAKQLHKEAEQNLYNVFVKYQQKRASEDSNK